jgi:hypothetical protein
MIRNTIYSYINDRVETYGGIGVTYSVIQMIIEQCQQNIL